MFSPTTYLYVRKEEKDFSEKEAKKWNFKRKEEKRGEVGCQL